MDSVCPPKPEDIISRATVAEQATQSVQVRPSLCAKLFFNRPPYGRNPRAQRAAPLHFANAKSLRQKIPQDDEASAHIPRVPKRYMIIQLKVRTPSNKKE